MSIYLQLFLTFLKIGAVSFGGGYAMIPLITDECSKWLSHEQIMNFIAVSESTPGPIAINMATFIGASQGGIWGAVLATLGVVLPSFIIILIIASIVKGLMKYQGVQAFLGGIRPIVIGLIIATGLTMALSVILSLGAISNGIKFEWRALVIFLSIATVYYTAKTWKKKILSPILLIIISAVMGVVLYGLI